MFYEVMKLLNLKLYNILCNQYFRDFGKKVKNCLSLLQCDLHPIFFKHRTSLCSRNFSLILLGCFHCVFIEARLPDMLSFC